MKQIFFSCLFLFSILLRGQKLDKDKSYYISAIGFWNVENLYDTLNDETKDDEEFLPRGKNAWTGERYRHKLDHLSDAISQMATDVTPDGLAILGLSEIENKQVVVDLVNMPALKKRNYQVVHIDGPDIRSVDPSFMYNPNYFKLKKAVSYPVKMVTDSNHKTRDVLVVSGWFLGDPLVVMVNHWPSRRGGEMRSRPNRNGAAKVARRIADSILKTEPQTKIAIMGDLNDNPDNESVKTIIRTYPDCKVPKEGCFFNPMEKFYDAGIGTLAWDDSWDLFDQILLSSAWLPAGYSTWQYYDARVFNKQFLKEEFGQYKGYPLRTYSGGNYTGGYSDHFPVYVIMAKERASNN